MATLDGIKIGNATYDFPSGGGGVEGFPITKETASSQEDIIDFQTNDGESVMQVTPTGVKVTSISDMDGNSIGASGNDYNNVAKNRLYVGTALNMIKNKIVNKENRCVLSFNGDSIIGSQLADITQSAEYSTYNFPPNMSKMIMARMFYDQFKFAGEDTQFRNIQHSDWVKNGFDVDNGRSQSHFNKFETMGCSASGETAEITITGYKFFKLIWSGRDCGEYTLNVEVSVNGGSYGTPASANVSLPTTITKSADNKTMQIYQVCTLDATKTYKIRVTSGSNPTNIKLWGCEYWNNPRLDVVVQAYSGSTAKQQLGGMLDAYNSTFHNPVLIITDVLFINDSSTESGETIEEWLSCNSSLYDKAKSKGTQVLAIVPHGAGVKLTKLAGGVPYTNNLPFIDIQKAIVAEPPTSSIVNNSDGIHLSNYGNQYYFNQIKKIFI